MVHLLLAVPLLAAQPGPTAPDLQIRADPFANTLRLREVAAAEGGVVVSQAGLISLFVAMRGSLPAGATKGGPLLTPSKLNWFIPGGFELLLPPLLGTACAWLVSDAPLAGGLGHALLRQVLPRALLTLPGEAAFAAGALFNVSPLLALAGLAVMLAADEIAVPLFASWGLHDGPLPLPAVLPPEPPQLQPPPSVRTPTLMLPLAFHF